jgi:hypothetical protein
MPPSTTIEVRNGVGGIGGEPRGHPRVVVQLAADAYAA